MGEIRDFLIDYSELPGIVHTELESVARRLKAYRNATELETKNVVLSSQSKPRRFFKLKVDDLAKAYRVMRVGYLSALY